MSQPTPDEDFGYELDRETKSVFLTCRNTAGNSTEDWYIQYGTEISVQVILACVKAWITQEEQAVDVQGNYWAIFIPADVRLELAALLLPKGSAVRDTLELIDEESQKRPEIARAFLLDTVAKWQIEPEVREALFGPPDPGIEETD